MLKLKGISKSYQQRGIVLDELDLEVDKGSTHAIIGPSGSGKTTLLNIIGLLEKADKGEIIFNNENISNLLPDDSADYRNKNIGFIFQDHLLLQHLTIIENIFLPLIANRSTDLDKPGHTDHIQEMIEKIGIADLRDKYPFQVSGGEAQRAAFVRALVNKPDLVLADEPTGSLDSSNSELLGSLLKELNINMGTALIVVTHSEKLASLMDSVQHFENGKLSTMTAN